MKTYEVEFEVIEIYIVEAESKEEAIHEAKLYRNPQGDIVAVVAEPTPPTEL